ncbi:hypothetical protein S245_052915, partial [Arachis hypogaea]
FAPLISCLYGIEWRWIWTHILFSLHFHIQFELKKKNLSTNCCSHENLFCTHNTVVLFIPHWKFGNHYQ